MAEDYYATLGVEKDATSQQIKRAFRQIARECHPDVCGADPTAEERFKLARKAYETLMDPVTRARYDRRGQRRARGGGGGSFFDAFYRHTGQQASQQPKPAQGARRNPHPGGRQRRVHDPGNYVSLDDLFNDFGFGKPSGGAKPSAVSGGRTAPRATRPMNARAGAEPPKPRQGIPAPGAEVHIQLEAPAAVARRGGSVTAVYYRMQRADSWRPGSADPGVVRIQDIADVRIIPGTTDGAVLRERGLGDAGVHGGPYGDLVVQVRVLPEPASAPEAPPPVSPEARQEQILEISVVEALLGGRVPLDTAQGRVKLSIPPGTSGGTRLRLRGKGEPAQGQAQDLYVSIRVVVPKNLDAESRALIERFAELNPDAAR